VSRALVLALALFSLAGTAHAGVAVRSVDTHAYPTLTLTLVTSRATTEVPRVTENGAPLPAPEITNLGRSKSVVLAIDRSRSMAGRSIRDAAAAADVFVRTKPQSDAIGVVAFGSHALALTGFSTSTIDADGALRTLSIDSRQGTALYDAVVMAAAELATQATPGRVIILLTDGRDVSSHATFAGAVAAARAAGASVYPIAIAGPDYDPAPLRALAAGTGGAFFRAAASSSLGGVYSQIAAELSRTWRISYLTAARPGDRLDFRVFVPGSGTASAAVGLAGRSTSSGGTSFLPPGLYTGPLGTLAVSALVGLLVLLGASAILVARRTVWVRERLEPHVAPARVERKRRADRPRFATIASLVRVTERLLGGVRQLQAVGRLLARADLPLRPAEFLYIVLAAAFAGALVVGIAMRSVPGFLLGFPLGGLVPVMFVSIKARRRLRAFEHQLPDLLITLAASLKAGHSFRQGIQTVVDEGQPPAADELKRVLTDTQLGRPMEDALAEMAMRVGSKNFEFVINAVTIQRQVGGSLAGLFDMVAETVRQRQQFARRIRSLTAMGRMSAYVLIGLPFFLAAAMTLLNRRFMAPLWERHAGHVMIAVGLTMMCVGSAILKKIVSFRG
jgi:tight adherence protein B